MRSRRRCSMCPAIHINSRSWLRSSSTHEPSDPPPRVLIKVLKTPGGRLPECHARHFEAKHATSGPTTRPGGTGDGQAFGSKQSTGSALEGDVAGGTRRPQTLATLGGRAFPAGDGEATAREANPPGRRLQRTDRVLRIGNDPSAGSPTETLLRLLLPLNAQVWESSRATLENESSKGPVQIPH